MSDTKISEFPEKALSSLDAAGTADFVGGYDYDVVSNNKTNKKFTFATLANWLLTKFKLTIAGSNQTVKTAVDTLNSKKRPYFSESTFTSGADLNQIFYGTYCCNTSALHNSILHKPDGMVTSIWRFTVVPLTNDGASNPTTAANWSRRAQIIYTGETEYWRVYQVDGSGNIDFGNWIETPKRSEITALNSNMWKKASVTIPAGQTKSLVAGRETLSCFVFITGPQASIRDGLYYLSGYTTARRVSLITLNASSSISFDMTNNETVTIPITNSSANPATVTVLVLYKTGSDITFQ